MIEGKLKHLVFKPGWKIFSVMDKKSWLTLNLRSTNICSCSKSSPQGYLSSKLFFYPKGIRLVCLLCLGSFLYSLQKRASKIAPLKRTAACQLAVCRKERTREDSEVTTNTAHNTKKHAQRQLSTIQAYLVLYQDQALTHVLKLIDMSLADIWGW